MLLRRLSILLWASLLAVHVPVLAAAAPAVFGPDGIESTRLLSLSALIASQFMFLGLLFRALRPGAAGSRLGALAVVLIFAVAHRGVAADAVEHGGDLLPPLLCSVAVCTVVRRRIRVRRVALDLLRHGRHLLRRLVALLGTVTQCRTVDFAQRAFDTPLAALVPSHAPWGSRAPPCALR